MSEQEKRNFRELAHALQTVVYHYRGEWLNVDKVELLITQDNVIGVEEELLKLRDRVLHLLANV
jgi:hypothetical protein